jgi:hypothetical protein
MGDYSREPLCVKTVDDGAKQTSRPSLELPEALTKTEKHSGRLRIGLVLADRRARVPSGSVLMGTPMPVIPPEVQLLQNRAPGALLVGAPSGCYDCSQG